MNLSLFLFLNLGVVVLCVSVPVRTMEQCACVERELEKVLHRFVMYGHQSEERLDELLHSVCEIRGQLVAFGKKKLMHTKTEHYEDIICIIILSELDFMFITVLISLYLNYNDVLLVCFIRAVS